MAMAMELASRSCCTRSALGPSSSRMRAPLSTRPQRATPRRLPRQVRVAEDVGTEEAEKPGIKVEAEEQRNSAPNSAPYPTGRKWTGYVEKDTAGQTNIYAVEPTVYVAESVFSSGEAGASIEGTEKNAAILFGASLVALAGAAAVLLTVGTSAPVPLSVPVGYNGPPLSYYIAKFSPEAALDEPVVPDLGALERAESTETEDEL